MHSAKLIAPLSAIELTIITEILIAITIRIASYYSLLTHLFEDLSNRPMAQLEPPAETLKQEVEALPYHYLSLPIGQRSLFD